MLGFFVVFSAVVALSNCQINSRIVGGEFAADGEFPFQISMQLRKNHICGGSILDAEHILTAAHCVTWSDKSLIDATSIFVRAGTNVLGIGGQEIQAKEVFVHEKYMMNLNDVALIKLSQPLSFNAAVQPIEMDKEEIPVGVPVTVSGWGKTATGGQRSEVLKKTTLTSMSIDRCDNVSGMGFKQIICLSHKAGTGACQGDSGGPAVYNGKLVGVASLVGKSCGSSDPDYYARVSLYYDWIKQKMAL